MPLNVVPVYELEYGHTQYSYSSISHFRVHVCLLFCDDNEFYFIYE